MGRARDVLKKYKESGKADVSVKNKSAGRASKVLQEMRNERAAAPSPKRTVSPAVQKIVNDAKKPLPLPGQNTGKAATFTPLPVFNRNNANEFVHLSEKPMVNFDMNNTEKYGFKINDNGNLRKAWKSDEINPQKYGFDVSATGKIVPVSESTKKRSSKEIENDIQNLHREMATAKNERTAQSIKRSTIGRLLDDNMQIADDGRAQANADRRIAELNTKKKELDKELLTVKKAEYKALSNNYDFDKLSKPITDKGDLPREYKYINDIDGYRKKERDNTNDSVSAGIFIYDRLSPEEIRTYNYIFATSGKEKADDYLEVMQEELNARQGAMYASDYAHSNTAEKILRGATIGVGSGIENTLMGLKQVLSEEAVPTTANQYAASEIRPEMSKAGRFFFDAGELIGGQLPNIVAAPFIGGGAASTLLGLSAGGNAYKEKIEEGYSPEEARGYATVIGLLEGALQYAIGGITSMGRKPSSKSISEMANAIRSAVLRLPVKLTISGGKEASEEMLQDFLVPVVETLMLGEEYEPAKLEDMLYTGLLAFATNGIFNAGDVVSDVSNHRAGKQIIKDGKTDALINAGLETDSDSQEYKLAKQLRNRQEKGKKISPYQLGELQKQTEFATAQEKASPEEVQTPKPKMGSNGQRGFAETYVGDTVEAVAPQNATAGYRAVYNATIENRAMTEAEAQAAAKIPDTMVRAAESAARADMPTAEVNSYKSAVREAETLLPNKIKNVENVISHGEQAGFDSTNAPKHVTKTQQKILDDLYKAMGVKGFYADGLKGNAEIYANKGVAPIARDFQTETIVNGKKKKLSAVYHGAHEVAMHRLMELAPEAGQAFINALYKYVSAGGAIDLIGAKKAQYAAQGVDISNSEAMEEIAANAILSLYHGNEAEFHRAIDRIIKGKDAQARTGAIKFREILDEIIAKLKNIVGKLSGKERAEAQADVDKLTELRNLFETAFAEGVAKNKELVNNTTIDANGVVTNKNSEEVKAVIDKSTQKNTDLADGDVKFSLKNTNLTQADVDAIQAIYNKKGEISVNAFSSEDVKAAENWARKFYSEIGIKSPFFRAWFGDWRANDKKTKVSVVYANKTTGKNPRGVFKNEDTGWNINSSSVGYDETVSHSGKDKLSLIAMRSIDEIINNAVLLDTEVSAPGRGKKSIYTAFMHKFYAYVVVDGKPCIAKMAVDESYAPKQNDTNKKFYHVRAIKIEPVTSVGIGFNHIPIMDGTSSNITVSELFNFVKALDEKFNPKKTSEVVNDGMPAVMYHGTTEDFTVFERGDIGYHFGTKDQAEDRVNLIARLRDTEHKKVMPVYLNIKNPYVFDIDHGNWNGAFVAKRMLAAKEFKGNEAATVELNEIAQLYDVSKEATQKSNEMLRKFFEKRGYDGIKYLNENEGETIDFSYIAFRKNQIKSATENIGTFDNGNNDIKFSLRDSEYMDAVNKGDMETAERMVEEAAKEAGYTVKGYHGTKADFTVFDKKKIKSGVTLFSSMGDGFYFTDDKDAANKYSQVGKVVDAFLKMGNAFVFVDKTNKTVNKLLKEFAQEYGGDFNIGEYSNYVNFEQRTGSVLSRIVKDKGTEFTKFLQEKGYNGIVYTSYNYDTQKSGKCYVVFDSNQIKSADPVTYDDNGNVIPLSERFNPENEDIRYSLRNNNDIDLEEAEEIQKAASDIKKLKKYVESGAITSEDYNRLIEQYGAIEPGEKPARDVQVPKKTGPKKKVSQTVRTILEAKATPDEAVPTIEEMVEDGTFSYDVHTDKRAISDAESYIKKYGWDESLDDWLNAVDKGEVSKKITAMGWALYNNAANTAATTSSETERTTAIKTSLKILDAMVRHQRSAAQALQATRILKKLSPETQLYGIQKSVSALQKELTDKYGDKAPGLKIDEDLAEEFINAKTPEERAAAEAEIYKDIGRQMPSTLADKWNAWRYLAMLGNLRTHVRNILGNAGFAPIVAVKDLTATAIESVVYRVSGEKTVRSKALITGNKADRALLKAAWEDYGNVADMISNGGKYNDFAMANKMIEEGRTIFKFKPLEAARKGNSKLLEAEDMWFARPHYAYALAQYCKANNITVEQLKGSGVLGAAREYAVKEAQKATYRDTNAFSQMVSGWGRQSKNEKNIAKKAFNAAVEGILPFRKTPANILARGVEYSPAGLLKSLLFDLYQVRKGKMTAAEAIDNISVGLTGTGLLALGVLLAAQGLVRGHGEDDEDEKRFKESMGHQAYALELPNGSSITLDWLAPEALPFFVGVNFWETTKGKGEEVNLSAMLRTISRISEPMLEMSCLQSLNALFESVGYASSNDTSGLISVLSSATTSYLMQGLPTLAGQAERTGEENRMTTYATKDAFLTKDMQRALGKASAKIPGWDYNQVPYIDAWGREEENGNFAKRAAENFISPAYYSKIHTDAVEKEVERLYEATSEKSVFPKRETSSDIKYKEKTYYKTPDEFVKYQKTYGGTSYNLRKAAYADGNYKNLSDKEKVAVTEKITSVANERAKMEFFKSRGIKYEKDSFVEKLDEAKRTGIGEHTVILAWALQKDVEGIKDKDGKTVNYSSALRKREAIDKARPSLSLEKRKVLYEMFDVGKDVIKMSDKTVKTRLSAMEKKYAKYNK